MQTKFEYRGTGGELFKALLKGWLLSAITFGIYMPWFLVGLIKEVTGKIKVRVGEDELDVAYTATGGELFKRAFVGYLLSMITLGIYLPWFIVDLVKFHQGHLTGVRSDGRVFRLNSTLTGGELFKTFFVNYLLTMITLGIYAPWMLCNVQRVVLGATTIREGEAVVGTVAYTGQGGELFKTFLLGYFLTMITLGIYGFWFQVKLIAFFQRGTEITVDGVTYAGNYDATGGESFKLNFVGYLLTTLTFGVYMFWYLADLIRFQLAHTSFAPKGEVPSAPALPSGGVRPARPTPSRALPAAGAVGALPFGLAPDPRDRRAAWARAYEIDAARTEPALVKTPAIAPPPPEPTPAPLSAMSLVIVEAPADTHVPPAPEEDAHDTKMNLEPPVFPPAEADPDVTETLGRGAKAPDYLTEILPPRNPVVN